jgi:hypothetical protein
VGRWIDCAKIEYASLQNTKLHMSYMNKENFGGYLTVEHYILHQEQQFPSPKVRSSVEAFEAEVTHASGESQLCSHRKPNERLV